MRLQMHFVLWQFIFIHRNVNLNLYFGFKSFFRIIYVLVRQIEMFNIYHTRYTIIIVVSTYIYSLATQHPITGTR